jgi:hypothetical protein
MCLKSMLENIVEVYAMIGRMRVLYRSKRVRGVRFLLDILAPNLFIYFYLLEIGITVFQQWATEATEQMGMSMSITITLKLA